MKIKKRIFFIAMLMCVLIASIGIGINIANAETNEVPWNLYKDGCLVINGTSEAHGNLYSTYSHGTVDLNKQYGSSSSETLVPWNTYKKNITSVEFASLTSPRYMSSWFYDCDKLVKFDSTKLDTSNVIELKYLFYHCSKLSDISDFSTWNTQSVTSMSWMFYDCTSLQDISALSSWNTQFVTDMSHMFYGCTSLQNVSALSSWITDSVTDMSSMFSRCTFLKDISALSSWITDSVTDMSSMFNGCAPLQDLSALSSWNTQSVTSMSGMFSMFYKDSRNEPMLKDISALSSWKTDSVTNMSSMFYNCESLQDLSALSSWNTQSVTSMSQMFYRCESLQDISALSSWNTQSVTSMIQMFSGCTSLKDISALSSWKTDLVTDMESMFYKCKVLGPEIDLSKWNVSKVKNFDYMFYECSSIKRIYLDEWRPPVDATSCVMFSQCSNLATIYCKYAWKCTDVEDYRKYPMFTNCISLRSDSSGISYTPSSLSRSESYLANPITGLFTLPNSSLGTESPSIQTVVLNEANKPYEDWKFKPGQFTYVISAKNGGPLPTQTIAHTDENGIATWGRIDFRQPGEYIYEITELEGDIPGVHYDTSPHEFKVTVSS